MKIHDLLNSLPELERERLLGRIEGMSLAMRICRNRAQDLKEQFDKIDDPEDIPLSLQPEATVCAGLIRLVQVALGNGSMKFVPSDLIDQEEIDRIY